MENFTHDRMDELLVKYLADEATPPEEQEVTAWLQEDEANAHYFSHFKLIWEQSLQSTATVTIPDANKAWQKFQRRINKPQPAKSIIRGGWRVAAAILLVAGAALITYLTVNKEPASPSMLAVATTDEVKADTLPDGSVATLNKHSVISYPSRFNKKTRKVKLEGEAFFAVSPDKDKPFIIDVNDVQIKVIGTSFNVRSAHGQTEVIVETGIVQVTKAGQTIELKAGERTLLQATDTATTTKKETSDDKLYNYYISRTFICDNTPLWKLVEKLNEAYNVEIVIADKSLRSLPLTVTFDEESLEMILKIVSQTLNVRVAQEDNKIRIY